MRRSALVVAIQHWPTLRELAAAGAGFFPSAVGTSRQLPSVQEPAEIIYCVRGGGWCQVAGRLHAVRRGDVAVVPPGLPCAWGPHRSDPWTIYWAQVEGRSLPGYWRALGVDPRTPVLGLGEDLRLIALFHELLLDLQGGATPRDLFHAAHTLGHLLSLMIRRRAQRPAEPGENVRKVARAIDYLSEHHHEPLKVASLAALVNLSADHFTALFKEQIGSTPRAYLHLLRMHRAAQWLTETTLPVKEIANRLGYRDPLHFSRTFSAFNGVSPTEYRTTIRGSIHAKPGSVHSP